MEPNVNSTIPKTLMTAKLFAGFWDRWLAHGIEREVVDNAKHEMEDIKGWTTYFSSFGEEHFQIAQNNEVNGQKKKAIKHYQLSGVYFNLNHWIFPDRLEEKIDWYKKSLDSFGNADRLFDIPCRYEAVSLDGTACPGRIRIPSQPKGSVIIINPIDSSKEELYSYENHFIELGYATFSFDGPGQGETFTLNGLKATTDRWSTFLDRVISLARKELPETEIYLFGTSSGANWSIMASNHPYVNRAIAVSPAVSVQIEMPDYFTERMHGILEHSTGMLPDIQELNTTKPILLFHGNKDVMVMDQDMYSLYDKLPDGKRLIEYADETHCCNNKLAEIRELADSWFRQELGG